MMVSFHLATGSPATLAVYDLNGRLVRQQGLGLAPGAHVLRLTDGAKLPAGMYFVRLTQERAVASRLIAILE